jgi:hypothetical protein
MENNNFKIDEIILNFLSLDVFNFKDTIKFRLNIIKKKFQLLQLREFQFIFKK